MAGLIPTIYNLFQPSAAEQRAEASKGLFGSNVRTEGTMQSTEFDELGNPINQQAYAQEPRNEGTGFLGSDRGLFEQSQLATGLIDAGYAVPEVSAIMKPIYEGNIAPEKPTNFMKNFEAFQSSSPEIQDQIIDYKRAGAQNINLGGGAGDIWTKEQVSDAGLPPETVVTTDKSGVPRILKKEKYSQPQILSGGFALRMNTANSDLESVMGSGFDPATVQQNSDFFAVPGTLANFIRTPKGQRYRQAQENWITANLRKESGAAIPEPEVEREMKKWFPVPGDSPEAITQKARARKDAERAMKKSSGGVFDELQAEKAAETSGNVSPSGVKFTVK